MIGYGSTVEVGEIDGANTNFTTIAGLQDITMPEATADDVEVTSMDSPNRTKEFIAGMIDMGEVSIEMNYEADSATDTLLTAIQGSGETVELRFTLNGMAQPVTYAAYCKTYGITAPVQDKMMATATFKVSAQIIA